MDKFMIFMAHNIFTTFLLPYFSLNVYKILKWARYVYKKLVDEQQLWRRNLSALFVKLVIV